MDNTESFVRVKILIPTAYTDKDGNIASANVGDQVDMLESDAQNSLVVKAVEII